MKMRTRIILGLVLGLGLAIFGLNRLYYSILDQTWAERSEAVQTAYEKTMLVKTDEVLTYYGERPYTVIYGEDKLGQKLVVWIGENEQHTEYAAAGASEATIKQKFLTKEPAAQVLRISPGKLKDQYVWEVFYKKQEEQGERFYYDFYSFPGENLDNTYRLSVQ